MRRTQDAVRIGGDYQYNAAYKGNPVQRFWHYSKKLAIAKYLPPAAGDFVLDVGCGSGVISAFLGDAGARVLGIDGNEAAVNFARTRYKKEGVDFARGLADDTLDLGELTDKIYCLEVIEHIYYEQGREMLRSFYKLLKPGGRVFLTTPNYKSLWPLIEWGMDKFGLAPKMEAAQHVERYDRSKLARLVSETGFKVEDIRTNCFLAPWVAPLSMKFAEKLDDIENRSSCGGSVLIFILVK